jgi:hypothetical protein
MSIRRNGSVLGKNNTPTSTVANGVWILRDVSDFKRGSIWPDPPPPPFVPSDVANLTCWLDATVGLFDATTGGSAVTTDASAVARWEDQSGNGRHFTQATSNDRPMLKTSTLNSNNIVRFDGSNDKLTSVAASNFVSASAHSVFVVGKAASVSTNAASAFQNSAFYGDSSGYISIYLTSTSLMGAYNWDGNADTATRSYTIGNNAIFYSQLSGGSIRARINGGTEASTVSGNTEVLTGTMQVGRQYNQNTYCLNGDIAEIIFYNVGLSSTNREKVEGYLAHKWGLTGNLPAGHPYKTVVP